MFLNFSRGSVKRSLLASSSSVQQSASGSGSGSATGSAARSRKQQPIGFESGSEQTPSSNRRHCRRSGVTRNPAFVASSSNSSTHNSYDDECYEGSYDEAADETTHCLSHHQFHNNSSGRGRLETLILMEDCGPHERGQRFVTVVDGDYDNISQIVNDGLYVRSRSPLGRVIDSGTASFIQIQQQNCSNSTATTDAASRSSSSTIDSNEVSSYSNVTPQKVLSPRLSEMKTPQPPPLPPPLPHHFMSPPLSSSPRQVKFADEYVKTSDSSSIPETCI